MIKCRNFLQAAGACAVGLLAACGSGEKPNEPAATAPPAATTPIAEVADSSSAIDEATVFASLPAPYNAANYANGRRQFKLCQSCHKISPDMTALVGPNLYGMFGRGVGEVEGFKYSKALVDADFPWTPEKLEEWLASPRDFLPGNQMSFAGIRKEDARHDLIAYLLVETARE